MQVEKIETLVLWEDGSLSQGGWHQAWEAESH